MITQKQIADHLGVSRQLVGFALNGGPISETTRERILQAAAELGYRPNEIARAMVTGRNNVIGFLGHSPELEATARLLGGVLEGIQDSYSLKLIRYDRNAHISAIIDRCLSLRLAGVIVNYLPTEVRADFYHEMKRFHIPVVALDSSLPHPGVRRVMSDDHQGCRLAIDHLVELGHQRVAFVTATPNDDVSIVREEGYRLAMQAHRLPIPDHYVVRGYWERPMIRTAQRAREMLTSTRDRPTAMFCVDDKTAMVVLREARRCGIGVPGALSIIGYANLDMAEFADPPLTTVAQPFTQIGSEAGRQLIQLIEAEADGAEAAPEQEGFAELLLPTKLILRETTAPPWQP